MTTTIKHWGRRYDAAQENICSERGCMREADQFDSRGQPKCVGHVMHVEVRRATESRSRRLS